LVERPPPGYERNDKPLPHEFIYYNDFDFSDGNKNKLFMSYIRTSSASFDPATIEVNPKNALFGVDPGPCICYDSIVAKISILHEFVFTKHAHITDQIPNIKIFMMKTFGAFKDSWTATDDVSGADTASILGVIDDDTFEDIIPAANGTKLLNAGNQPFSTKTMTEAIATYNLTTTAVLESNNFNHGQFYDVNHYGTNSQKLQTLNSGLKQTNLNANKKFYRSFEKRFVPKHTQFGHPYLFFGENVIVPKYTHEQVTHSQGHVPTAGGHIAHRTHVRFNEWNKDFNQRRK